jgi:hypothetical protein
MTARPTDQRVLAAARHVEAARAQAVVHAVQALHQRVVRPLRRDACSECGTAWPCNTARIIKGDQ